MKIQTPAAPAAFFAPPKGRKARTEAETKRRPETLGKEGQERPKMQENWSKRQLQERLPLQEALGGLLASILEPTWAHVGAENRLESGSGCLLTRTSSDVVRSGSANQREPAANQLASTPKTIVSRTVCSRSAYQPFDRRRSTTIVSWTCPLARLAWSGDEKIF